MGRADNSSDQVQRFAIVGYAARFPGAPDADQFWSMLRDGRDAISEVPEDRWNVDDFFDPDPGTAGGSPASWRSPPFGKPGVATCHVVNRESGKNTGKTVEHLVGAQKSRKNRFWRFLRFFGT